MAEGRSADLPRRTVAVWCPDWPVVAGAAAAGLVGHEPAAVIAANRVVSCSASARAHGVRIGQRCREAQSRCPDLAVLTDDPDRDARAFEPVVAAVEALMPGVEVVRPGLVAGVARGAVRYFGSESVVAERLVDVVAAETGAECQIGIADGLFAATLAARQGLLVAPGGSREFLAGLGIAALRDPGAGAGREALVDLLHRLGLRRLGAFAALPAGDVSSRFGPEGVRAHRLAQGREERPLARRRPPPDLTVTRRLDPPVERVDAAAFAAREPADELHSVLAARGLACVRLGVSACTEAGEELHRVWRCAEPLTASGIADRVRWQLDGWLSSRRGGPSTGITVLRLVPEEVIGGQALQRGLWGGSGEQDERAGRALVRVQGMLGPESVFTGVVGGGRSPADRVRLVPWGDEPVARHPAEESASRAMSHATGPETARVPVLGGVGSAVSGVAGAGDRGVPRPSGPVAAVVPAVRRRRRQPGSDVVRLPWPGQIPAPSPSRVLLSPLPAEVLDDCGRVVEVNGRGMFTAVPHRVAVGGRPPRRVLSWAGPWPVEERWWVPEEARCGARLQAVLDAEPGRRSDVDDRQLAVLLIRADGTWQIEGIYE